MILNPGDAISYEDDVVHTSRGAGSEPGIVLGTFLLTTGEPLLMQADVEIGGTDSAGSGLGGVDTGRPTIFEMP